MCMVVAVSDLSNFLANAKGDRSIDEISKQAHSEGHPISRSAIAKYLRGEHGPRPPESTLEGLAAGFGVDLRELRRLAGRTPGELGPYVPTDESASLTRKQRDALDQLIKTIVSDRGGSSASTGEPDEKRGRPTASAVEDDEVIPLWAQDEAANRSKEPKGHAFGNQDEN